MSEPKFTPGPWFVTHPWYETERWIDVSFAGSITKAGGPPIFIARIMGNEKNNAALIVAAPALYEALEELVTEYKSDTENEYGPGLLDNDEIYQRCLSALALARGEAAPSRKDVV